MTGFILLAFVLGVLSWIIMTDEGDPPNYAT